MPLNKETKQNKTICSSSTLVHFKKGLEYLTKVQPTISKEAGLFSFFVTSHK